MCFQRQTLTYDKHMENITCFKRSQWPLMVLLNHTRCLGQMGTAYRATSMFFEEKTQQLHDLHRFVTYDIIAPNLCEAELHCASRSVYPGKSSFRSSTKNGSELCPCSFANIWIGIEKRMQESCNFPENYSLKFNIAPEN